MLAGSIYALSTLAFGLFAGFVGVRPSLLPGTAWLRPERCLGLSLLLTATIGYVPQMMSQLLVEATPTVRAAMMLTGRTSFCLGVAMTIAFTIKVFRPEARWARGLAVAIVAPLWLCHAVLVTSTDAMAPTGPVYVAYLLLSCVYPIWMAVESLAYHRMMRRRVAIGLADPVVANRFLLWGIASLTTTAAVCSIVSVMAAAALAGGRMDPSATMVQIAMIATSAFGVATNVLYWLTLFPPKGYVARLRRTSPA